MKRKLIAILLAVFTAFACVPAFAAGDLLISPAHGSRTSFVRIMWQKRRNRESMSTI